MGCGRRAEDGYLAAAPGRYLQPRAAVAGSSTRYPLAAVAGACLPFADIVAQDFTGKVVGITEGDTIQVMPGALRRLGCACSAAL